MGIGIRREEALRGIAQEQLSEAVQGAVVLMPKGRDVAARSFGLLGSPGPDVTPSTSGFGPYNLFAVTESGLHAFAVGGNTSAVRSTVGYWPWGTVRATLEDRGMSRTLTLTWADGSETSLEAPVKGVQRFQLGVLEQIVRRSAMAQDGGPMRSSSEACGRRGGQAGEQPPTLTTSALP
jgi:hypothetical protein